MMVVGDALAICLFNERGLDRAIAAKVDEVAVFVSASETHNLKNVNVELPRDKLVVFTGLSGSGKSSLAFDTIYAEGQRRYVESLSAYARQFLGQMEKPDVEAIDGLSPAIAIEQKTAGGVVTSKYPNHLWMVDVTTVPTGLGFWCSWLPFAL